MCEERYKFLQQAVKVGKTLEKKAVFTENLLNGYKYGSSLSVNAVKNVLLRIDCRRDMLKEMTEEIKKACQVMNEGGVILYPTDTIWGIGCDATNEEAVRRVYEIKRRSDSKAMLVLVDSSVKVDFYVRDVPDVAWDLIELADKPLTIIYSEARNLAPNLLAEDGSVGIRVTKEEFSQRLCQQFRKAIVSTSANVSGEPSPACFGEISDEIKSAVDYVVGCRQNETGHPKPSSILKLGKGGVIKIIRE